MVSGFVTSPELQLRICLEDARPISMASKLLMSIMQLLGLLAVAGGLDVAGVRLFHVFCLALFARFDLRVLALVGRLAVGRADAREVDAELLGGAQEVVVLVAHLGARALLGDDVYVERQR